MRKILIFLLLITTMNLFAIEVRNKNYFNPTFVPNDSNNFSTYRRKGDLNVDPTYFWENFDYITKNINNLELKEIDPTNLYLEWASSILYLLCNTNSTYFYSQEITFPCFMLVFARIGDHDKEYTYAIFYFKKAEYNKCWYDCGYKGGQGYNVNSNGERKIHPHTIDTCIADVRFFREK
jgi:hypothetical protein